MKVLQLAVAAIEQADFPDETLENKTNKFLAQLEVDLQAIGFTPSSALGEAADELEEALTDYYAADETDEDEDEDLDRDADTLPIPTDSDQAS